MMINGTWEENITCPRCRARHPARLTCLEAGAFAKRESPAQVTAAMISELRALSDEPVMECKRALVACNGDIYSALEWLRSQRAPGAEADRLARLERDVAAIKRFLGMPR